MVNMMFSLKETDVPLCVDVRGGKLKVTSILCERCTCNVSFNRFNNNKIKTKFTCIIFRVNLHSVKMLRDK